MSEWTEMVGTNGHTYLVDLTRAKDNRNGVTTAPARRWIAARNDYAKGATTAVRLDAMTRTGRLVSP